MRHGPRLPFDNLTKSAGAAADSKSVSPFVRRVQGALAFFTRMHSPTIRNTNTTHHTTTSKVARPQPGRVIPGLAGAVHRFGIKRGP